MKIEFYTEEKYGSYLLGEYEYHPLHIMEKNEEIPLKLKDIVKEVPSVFGNMQALLVEIDEGFQKCIKRRPEIEEAYLHSKLYTFRIEEEHVSPHAHIIVVNNFQKCQKDIIMNYYYVPENCTLRIIVCPERCTICLTDNSFINKRETASGTILECLSCIDRQKKYREEYKIKEELAEEGYYEKWNRFLCDECEAYGHECRVCRSFGNY